MGTRALGGGWDSTGREGDLRSDESASGAGRRRPPWSAASTVPSEGVFRAGAAPFFTGVFRAAALGEDAAEPWGVPLARAVATMGVMAPEKPEACRALLLLWPPPPKGRVGVFDLPEPPLAPPCAPAPVAEAVVATVDVGARCTLRSGSVGVFDKGGAARLGTTGVDCRSLASSQCSAAVVDAAAARPLTDDGGAPAAATPTDTWSSARVVACPGPTTTLPSQS